MSNLSFSQISVLHSHGDKYEGILRVSAVWILFNLFIDFWVDFTKQTGHTEHVSAMSVVSQLFVYLTNGTHRLLDRTRWY